MTNLIIPTILGMNPVVQKDSGGKYTDYLVVWLQLFNIYHKLSSHRINTWPSTSVTLNDPDLEETSIVMFFHHVHHPCKEDEVLHR
jgi:hypothetical protein